MPTHDTVLRRFSTVPDKGLLKCDAGEYPLMQNIRGIGGRGFKRAGIKTSARLSTAPMGIFDLYMGAGTPDKVAIITRDGYLTLYGLTELVLNFDHLMASGVNIALQSPDLTWYLVAPNATTGIMRTTEATVAPTTIRSSDLVIQQGQLLGFATATLIWGQSITTGGFIRTTEFVLAEATTTYTADLAFSFGHGPVFEDANVVLHRLNVANGGILGTTEL